MINFLTDDFFKEQRQKRMLLISGILILFIITGAIHITLNLYLNMKVVDKKQAVVEARNKELDEKLSKINQLKEKKKQVEQELEAKQEKINSMVSSKKIIEELSRLSMDKLHLQKFNVEKNEFTCQGITANINYLNLLNKKLANSNFFTNFYLDDIEKGENFVEFTLRGQIKKGE